MPKRVDHDARRDEVVAVASRLIAELGLDAVTVRLIAEQAGYSTAVVSHYFHDKKQLLLLTYRAGAKRAVQRFEAARSASGGDLRTCLETYLPLDEGRWQDWRIWLAFWAAALADAEFAAEQRRQVAHAAELIAGLLPTRDRMEAENIARHLLVVLQGIAIGAIFDVDYWSAERQREGLATGLTGVADSIAALRRPAGSAAAGRR